MPDQPEDTVLTLDDAPVSIHLEPAHNALNSLRLLSKNKCLAGAGDWVARTTEKLTRQERDRLNLVFQGFAKILVPSQSWPSFPAFLDYFAIQDPALQRDELLNHYGSMPPVDQHEQGIHKVDPSTIDWDAVLGSAESYVAFLGERYGKHTIDIALESEAYTYVIDPPAMQTLIVSSLRDSWDRYLAEEWHRVEPMLQEVVTAFQQTELYTMTRLEALQYVLGQEVDQDAWEHKLSLVGRVVFVPSPHLGPLYGAFHRGDTLWVMFGARLPPDTHVDTSNLIRAEIVVRLGSLADDSRLRILKLIAEEGEKYSQEIMQELDMSQSTTSRHLKQLSAAGFLTERRCDGAKCYQINTRQIQEALQTLSKFLLSG